MNKRTLTIITFAACAGILSPLAFANAQTAPELFITWHAESFAPLAYAGKRLPTRETPVRAALELIDNGSLASLLGTEVRWFVNGSLFASGINRRSISFTVPRQASGSISVRVELPSYRGARLQKTIAVPVATPEVVLVSPYADGTIPAGTASFTALPYFFNVARIGELVFSWVVNGTPAGGSVAAPNLLSLDVSGAEAGNAVLLAVTAENPVKGIEVGRASTQLTVR